RPSRSGSASAGAGRLFALATAVIGVIVSLFLWQARRAWESRLFDDAFRGVARNLNFVLERELNLFVEVLESLGRVHSISADVDRQAFAEFVSKGLLYHRYVLDVFGWAPRVPYAERPLYEAAMRQGGYPDFRLLEMGEGELVDAPARPEYFPISYAEPPDARAIPLGLDLASDPASRQAMETSRTAGQTTVGGTAGRGAGRLVFSPIYRGELPPGASREQRGDVDGFVVAVLEPERVLRRALSYVGPQGIDVYVLDPKAPAGEQVLYIAAGRRIPAATVEDLEENASRVKIPTYRYDISVAGRAWTVVCVPSSSFIDLYRTWQPLGLLLSGLVVTALVTSQLLFVAGRARKIEQIVRERTAEVTAANIKLKKTMQDRRRLEQEILHISDREKRRVGQDLHDSLGQQLAGIGYLTSALERELSGRSLPESQSVAKIGKLMKEAIAQVRRIARGLAPVEMAEEGLAAALERLAADSQSLFGVACRFEAGSPVLIYDSAVAINLYHIAQEAVSNAARHASPREIVVRLESDGARGELRIEDDGSGMPAGATSKGGMGLQIMRYRTDLIGGRLEIMPRPSGGTIVKCEFENEEKRGPRITRIDTDGG
ncbi:MAG: CHASE domain-containing protein, partial [Candidatus Eisenbacteria bacterium]